MEDLGVPAVAGTVSKRLHGETVLDQRPARNPVPGWRPLWFLSGAGNLFFCSPVSISYRDPRSGPLAVCCCPRRPGKRVVVHLVRNFEMSEEIAAR